MTTFGVEYEVAHNGLSVLYQLHRLGAVANDYLCPYHGCGGPCCRHDNTEWLFSAQEDCTVSAEFPSKILEWGSERAELAFRTLERAAVLAGADLSGDSGMHVHVAKPFGQERATGEHLTEREAATWRLLRMFVRYQDDLVDIASGHRPEVRGYNAPMRVTNSVFWTADLTGPAPDCRPQWGSAGPCHNAAMLVDGSWLDVSRHSATYEFRLWNASKAAWRIRLCVAFSVAMTEAAAAGIDVTEHDPRPVEEVLSPWLDDIAWAGILRQRFAQGGLEVAA